MTTALSKLLKDARNAAKLTITDDLAVIDDAVKGYEAELAELTKDIEAVKVRNADELRDIESDAINEHRVAMSALESETKAALAKVANIKNRFGFVAETIRD